MRQQTRHDPSIWSLPRLVGVILGAAYGLLTFAFGIAAAAEAGTLDALVVESLVNAIVGFITGFMGTVILLTYIRVSKL